MTAPTTPAEELRAAAERLRELVAARDFIDYPTGWALQADPRLREHHPKCSAAQSAGAFLCDCGAIQDLWCRLRDELGMGVPERIREYAAKYATPSPTGGAA